MIKQGSKVKAHYTGRLTNNEVFDTSLQEGRQPLEFQIGGGQLIPGFENGVLGLSIGDKKTIEIPASDAYGEYREDLKISVPKSNLPSNVEIGMPLQAEIQGQLMNFMVRHVDESNAIVDGNHPLAGQTLIFDVEILEVAD